MWRMGSGLLHNAVKRRSGAEAKNTRQLVSLLELRCHISHTWHTSFYFKDILSNGDRN